MASPFLTQGINFDNLFFHVNNRGTLWLWGANNAGQLGDNTTVNKSSPVQTITGGSNWTYIAVGTHTAAIKTDGTLWLWGTNINGQLGDNTTVRKSSPVQTIAGGNNWAQVSVRANNTAAIKTDGTLWLWGANDAGQLGDNTTVSKSSPVQTIAGGSNWLQVSTGTAFTAAIKTDGTLWLWGRNNAGQLGDNSLTDKSSPVQTVSTGTNWKQVSCGESHSGAIKTDGTLWMWGSNTTGQLGDNTTVNKSSPVQTITGGNNWLQVSAGSSFTGAIKTDGTLWVWGFNGNSELGDNTLISKSSPIQTVAGGSNWYSVSAGMYGAAIRKLVNS